MTKIDLVRIALMVAMLFVVGVAVAVWIWERTR